MLYSLGELFDLQMGKTPLRENLNYWNTNDNKWISISDLTQSGKYITNTKEYISDDAVAESGIRVIPADTVIMSFKLSIGKVAITKEDIYSNEAIMAFRDKHIIELLPEYIYYLFKYKDWSAGTNKAVMGKTLNKLTLSQVKIDVCPIERQKEIVDSLERVDIIIELCNSMIKKMDMLIKSQFVEMFGDLESSAKKFPVVKMEEIFTIGSSKRIYQNEQTKSGVPFFRIADLIEIIENGNNMPSLYISEERYENLKQNGYVPKPGDILVTARGTLGSCYIMKETDKFYFQDGMISWMYNMRQDVSSNYIYYLFQMPGFRKQFDSTIAGSTVSYLSIAMLKKLEVILPPLSLQNEFATFVREIDKLKLVAQKRLEKMETLKNKLMQQFFS